MIIKFDPFSVLFCTFRTYRQGMHDLKVWPDMLPDPSVNSTTPGKSKDHKDQMSKLAKVVLVVWCNAGLLNLLYLYFFLKWISWVTLAQQFRFH